MKLKMRARLPGCFGGGRACAVLDEEQTAALEAEVAAGLARIDKNIVEMARGVEELRELIADHKRATEELERLLPEIFLHRSRWDRVKDAFRRPRGKVAPVPGEGYDGVVTVETMSPFLRNYLSMDV
ncbi:unnamed protein product [Urochloa humidicola]